MGCTWERSRTLVLCMRMNVLPRVRDIEYNGILLLHGHDGYGYGVVFPSPELHIDMDYGHSRSHGWLNIEATHTLNCDWTVEVPNPALTDERLGLGSIRSLCTDSTAWHFACFARPRTHGALLYCKKQANNLLYHVRCTDAHPDRLPRA